LPIAGCDAEWSSKQGRFGLPCADSHEMSWLRLTRYLRRIKDKMHNVIRQAPGLNDESVDLDFLERGQSVSTEVCELQVSSFRY